MTYDRGASPHNGDIAIEAIVSHTAELVRGGPLIRPFGAPSPQGEKGSTALCFRFANKEHVPLECGPLRSLIVELRAPCPVSSGSSS